MNRPGASDRSELGGTRGVDQEILWRRAQRRSLAYLQAMGAPTLEGHELVMEALRRAHQTIQGTNRGDPVRETIQALRRLLCDRGLLSHGGPHHGKWFKYGSLGRQASRTEGDLSGGITSMPSMTRGFMSTDEK
jgi:hypothetical protein